MTGDHFFEDAPYIGWWQYIQDKTIAKQRPPSLLPVSKKMPQKLVRSPCGTYPSRMKSELSPLYCKFLQMHFFPDSHTHSLVIPEKHMEECLRNGVWIGAEVRDTRGSLVGIAVSKYIGNEPTIHSPMGIIDYLCVHPLWRKKGIPNILLRAVYTFSAQQTPSRLIQFFQKEGIPATIPPLHVTSYYTRSPRKYTSAVPIRKILPEKYATLLPYIQNTMNSQKTLICRPSENMTFSEIQVYESKVGVGILLHPSHEINKTTMRPCATILGWYATTHHILPTLSYELEAILDSIHQYGHYYAPSFYPMLDCMGWGYVGIISTHAFHYDPGSLHPSHMISLCTG